MKINEDSEFTPKILRNSHSNFGFNTVSRITSITAFKKTNSLLSVSEDGYLIKWSIDDPGYMEHLYLNLADDGMECEYKKNDPQPEATYLMSVDISPSEDYAVVGGWDGIIRVSPPKPKEVFNISGD